MNTYTNKIAEKNNQPIANSLASKSSALQLKDNRSQSVVQKKANSTYQLMEADNSAMPVIGAEMPPPGRITRCYQMDKDGKLHEKSVTNSFALSGWEQVGICHNLPVWQTKKDKGLHLANRVVGGASAIGERVNQQLTSAVNVGAVAIGAAPLIAQGDSLISAAQPLLTAMHNRDSESYGVAVAHVQDVAMKWDKALSIYLRRNVVGALVGLVAGTGTVVLGKWLSTLTFWAPWLGIATTALSSIYSVYLIYRWLTQEIIPAFFRLPLAVLNGVILMGTLGTAAWQLIEGDAFQHPVFAALPFALLLERLIAKIVKGITNVREEHTQRNDAATAGNVPEAIGLHVV